MGAVRLHGKRSYLGLDSDYLCSRPDGIELYLSGAQVAIVDNHKLDEDEKTTIRNPDCLSGSRGGAQFMTIVNESGLYPLIMRSSKPEAKAVKSADSVLAEMEQRALVAEQKVGELGPAAAVATEHFGMGRHMPVTRFARTLNAVNSIGIKGSLMSLGYLYKAPNGGYRTRHEGPHHG